MEHLTNEYWEERYRTASTGWDIGEVSTPLKNYIDGIESKSQAILVPGAGNGYEVQYLHRLGFHNVTMLDFAIDPLQKFQKENPEFPKSHLIHEDFFAHHGSYDLVIEQTFFCALNPNLRAAYVEKMSQLLKPGGLLVGLLFGVEMHDPGPPFGGTQEEYEYLFSAHFNILKMEPCVNSIAPRKGRELFIKFQNKH
jgi:methyl halide transferase